ncbi:MAG: adenylate/guanylate cyclase domain-containing protein [Pseudomonadota bacterium]|nr:adenylate/guanylate cyclase domain-containing protein [Pseudomonadota bacterium]
MVQSNEPLTFARELEASCHQYLPIAAGASVIAWLPYVWLDAQVHPELPVLPWIRAGFTLVAVIVLLCWRFTTVSRRLLVAVQAGYLLLATGVVTGLVGADPIYIGGYCMVLCLAPVPPLPRAWTWGLLVGSLLLFAAFGSNVSFPAGRGAYSRNDLQTGALLSFLFVFLIDRMRRRSWEQAVEIGRQKQLIEADHAHIDRLLHNILPPTIAAELKLRGVVEPQLHPDATVVFTDFAGFTGLAERMPPSDLVALLHRCFSAFDRVMERHGLEKLKTIGDAYMFASGLPQPSPGHAVTAVRAAIEIRDWMDALALERTAAGLPTWQVRIGVHTGPLVAGVVGEKKFVYDVWGDTVNVASRMESSGAPGEVNVSATTASRVEACFTLEPRGQVLAKNKGMMEMFFVRGALAAGPPEA